MVGQAQQFRFTGPRLPAVFHGGLQGLPPCPRRIPELLCSLWCSPQRTAAWHRLTVSLAVYATFLKRHDVLRQRSRLIREDVVDLPQLLVQRGGPGLCGCVLLRVIHLQVPVYKIALAQTNHFDAK